MSQEGDPMAAYTTLVNLPHFLSSFTSLETGALVLFLAAVFTVQLILLQSYSGRRRWLPLILCAAALLALELGILAVKYLFLSVFSGDGWSSPLLLVYSAFLLLLYFAWMALFTALLALLTYLILMSPQGAALAHFFTQNSTANRINKTINWIRQNTGKPFDIDQLAEMAHMTRSTFYRHFKTITKLSPLQYHKRQCLYQAQHLMMTKGYSATQAAYEVGYASPNQFSREYKRTFGMPPRQFVTAQTKPAGMA